MEQQGGVAVPDVYVTAETREEYPISLDADLFDAWRHSEGLTGFGARRLDMVFTHKDILDVSTNL